VTGLLLDTNALIYLANGEPISAGVVDVVAQAQRTRDIFVSPFVGWELGVIATKEFGAPNFGGQPVTRWLTTAIRKLKIKLAPLTIHIATEAAEVPTVIGHKDPADCFMVATARVLDLTLVTRDRRLLQISLDQPGYLSAIEC
jgi:PIN domain nuclease of toxin-antitoxin system